MRRFYLLLTIQAITFFLFCQNRNLSHQQIELQSVIDSIKEQHIPDKRIKVFDIEVDNKIKEPTLRGVTSDVIAYQALLEETKKRNVNFINKIELLPSKNLGDKTYGVINLSVADIRADKKFSSEMATQAILGTPIHVLQKDDWYRIQTPDGYIGWTQKYSFQLMNLAEMEEWNNAKKIVFTDYFGFSYQEPDINSQHISDLVSTNILKFEGKTDKFYKVSYPDGRKAYILKDQSMLYDEWTASRKVNGDSFVQEAFNLMGIPYVWGGTSVKGMDCSGFTKTILFMHGIILMRDASQQAYTGCPIDISTGYENLKTGDLMFFGKKAEDGKKEKIRHVAFYIGNKKFIHASGLIRIGSLDPENPDYDELNTKEFIKATRIEGAIDRADSNIWSIKNNSFYK